MHMRRLYLPVKYILPSMLVNRSISLTEQVFYGRCPPHHERTVMLQSNRHHNLIFSTSLDDSLPGSFIFCPCSPVHVRTDYLVIHLN